MKKKYEDFELTPEQIKACKAVERAINKAIKVGVYILAKQNALMGFNKKSFDSGLAADLHEGDKDYNFPIPYKDMGRIVDSGADDMEYFKQGSFEH